jgi:hypothetical protein
MGKVFGGFCGAVQRFEILAKTMVYDRINSEIRK